MQAKGAPSAAAGQRVVFGALLALHVAPIWAVRYPPSCDGPAHLETAYVLLHRGSPDDRLYAKHLALRRDPTVAWFPALALAALMRLVEPVAALKLLVTGQVVLFPLALRYALLGFSARAAWLACAGFPLVYSRPLLYGFYGFLYGLSAFLFTLGWWLRRRPGAPYAWPLTGLTLALQLTHVFSLVAALLTFGALGLAALWRERWSSPEPEAVTRGLREHLLAPLHAFLPALILTGSFLLPRVEAKPAQADAPAERRMVDVLRTLPVVVEGDRAGEAGFAVVFLACLAVIVLRVARSAWRAGRWICADGLLAAAAVWLGLWLFGPTTLAHGSFLRERCALYFLVTVLLWCAGRGLPAEERLSAGMALLAAGWVGLHAARFRQVSRDVEEYTSLASWIAPGSTLLPVGTPAAGAGGIPFLEHAASYLAVERGGINLGNYQPGTDHFPLAWRPRRAGREETPDYMLIPSPDEDEDEGALVRALTAVRGEYSVAGVSRPRGQVTLLRRRRP